MQSFEYRVQTIQYIESMKDRVINLFIHLRSLHGRFLGGPILGLFLRGQKWVKIRLRTRFSDTEKLSMLLYVILTTTTC